jgi:hypothetical protein
VIYLPQRDAQLEFERARERGRAEAEKRADHERELARQRELEERQDAEKAALQLRYQGCLRNASNNYNASWASQCKFIGGESQKKHSDCISSNLDKSFCDRTYPIADASPDCALPQTNATNLNNGLEKARDRCLQGNRSGLQ